MTEMVKRQLGPNQGVRLRMIGLPNNASIFGKSSNLRITTNRLTHNALTVLTNQPHDIQSTLHYSAQT